MFTYNCRVRCSHLCIHRSQSRAAVFSMMRFLLASWSFSVVMTALTDQHDNCQTWAEQGECERNEAFMKTSCALSCAGAKTYSTQLQKECKGYAQQGECSRNPAFMLSSCRAECDAWEKEHNVHRRSPPACRGTEACRSASLLQMLFATLPCAVQQLFIDRDSRCVEWSLLGGCKSDPVKMAKQCNTSCTVQERCARSTYSGWSVGICDKALRCEAKDKRGDCAARAAKGECRSSPTKMAVECLNTCASKDVDAVLSAQCVRVWVWARGRGRVRDVDAVLPAQCVDRIAPPRAPLYGLRLHPSDRPRLHAAAMGRWGESPCWQASREACTPLSMCTYTHVHARACTHHACTWGSPHPGSNSLLVFVFVLAARAARPWADRPGVGGGRRAGVARSGGGWSAQRDRHRPAARPSPADP